MQSNFAIEPLEAIVAPGWIRIAITWVKHEWKDICRGFVAGWSSY